MRSRERRLGHGWRGPWLHYDVSDSRTFSSIRLWCCCNCSGHSGFARELKWVQALDILLLRFWYLSWFCSGDIQVFCEAFFNLPRVYENRPCKENSKKPHYVPGTSRRCIYDITSVVFDYGMCKIGDTVVNDIMFSSYQPTKSGKVQSLRLQNMQKVNAPERKKQLC